jgi:hypothetical protein
MAVPPSGACVAGLAQEASMRLTNTSKTSMPLLFFIALLSFHPLQCFHFGDRRFRDWTKIIEPIH